MSWHEVAIKHSMCLSVRYGRSESCQDGKLERGSQSHKVLLMLLWAVAQRASARPVMDAWATRHMRGILGLQLKRHTTFLSRSVEATALRKAGARQGCRSCQTPVAGQRWPNWSPICTRWCCWTFDAAQQKLGLVTASGN